MERKVRVIRFQVIEQAEKVNEIFNQQFAAKVLSL
ncbi:hypothetical protein J2S09_002617 [Bacillus fengqiuensis]|nr:hypothetical protein [Bacillus fengqiuensis]